MTNKGISPLVATVLLIGIAIVLFGVVFFWLSSLVSEHIMKSGQLIENQCESLVFTASASGDNVFINNQGNIAIAGVIAKAKIDGKTLTSKAKKPVDGAVAGGETDVIDVSGGGFTFAGAQASIMPILQGKTTSGEVKRYICKTKSVEL